MNDWDVMQSGYQDNEIYPSKWDDLRYYMLLMTYAIKYIQADKEIKFKATLSGGFFMEHENARGKQTK
ncbi:MULTISPECIES: hypothetical protein [Acinetobacter]|uniref:Uncharacterized protein n=1 Tax=Acinetobacter piscicola TaxID=2006115 RepID=A0A7S6VW85_9GAMM|nr:MULTISPECIES: hypothetical protein [Acinetobacter]QOW46049.1 hypothetical protein G0028_09165 [Acinetobacter piscicola]